MASVICTCSFRVPCFKCIIVCHSVEFVFSGGRGINTALVARMHALSSLSLGLTSVQYFTGIPRRDLCREILLPKALMSLQRNGTMTQRKQGTQQGVVGKRFNGIRLICHHGHGISVFHFETRVPRALRFTHCSQPIDRW